MYVKARHWVLFPLHAQKITFEPLLSARESKFTDVRCNSNGHATDPVSIVLEITIDSGASQKKWGEKVVQVADDAAFWRGSLTEGSLKL